jgi:hypothetical protein
MEDPLGVGEGNGLGDVDQRGQVSGQELSDRAAAIGVDQRLPRKPPDEPLGQLLVAAPVPAQVVNRHDVRVLESRRRERLVAEALLPIHRGVLGPRHLAAQPLDGHRAAEGELRRLPHLAEASPPDQPAQPERRGVVPPGGLGLFLHGRVQRGHGGSRVADQAARRGRRVEGVRGIRGQPRRSPALSPIRFRPHAGALLTHGCKVYHAGQRRGAAIPGEARGQETSPISASSSTKTPLVHPNPIWFAA